MKKEIFFSFAFFIIFIITCLFGVYKVKGIIQNYEEQKNYELTKNLNINLPDLLESGGIDIRSEAHFDVYLDTKFVGKSPLKINNLKPQKYFIQIKYPNYMDFYLDTEVKKGQFSLINPILFSKDIMNLTSQITDFSAESFVVLDNILLARNYDLAQNNNSDNIFILSLKDSSFLGKIINLASSDNHTSLFNIKSEISFDKNIDLNCISQISENSYLDSCNYQVYSNTASVDLTKLVGKITKVDKLNSQNLIIKTSDFVYNYDISSQTLHIVHKLSLNELYLGIMNNTIAIQSNDLINLYEPTSTDKLNSSLGIDIHKTSYLWQNHIVTVFDKYTEFKDMNKNITYLTGQYHKYNDFALFKESDESYYLYLWNNKILNIAKSNFKTQPAKLQFSDNFLVLDNFHTKNDSYIYFSNERNNVLVVPYEDGYDSLFIIENRLFIKAKFEERFILKEVNYLY